MKPSIGVPRASHVNTGTAIPPEKLPWPATGGRVIRMPRTHMEVDQRSEVTPYGGLALVAGFARRFKVAQRIDQHVRVFKVHWEIREQMTEADVECILVRAHERYITPADHLAGRGPALWAQRDARLEAAREVRRLRRAALHQEAA